VIYAVTKLNFVDVLSLCSCAVCDRVTLSSVVCVCVCVCLEFMSWGNLVIESYGRILYKNLMNVHLRNSV
jgi:hypothetical protein